MAQTIYQLTSKSALAETDELEIQETDDGDSKKTAISSVAAITKKPRVLSSDAASSVTPTTDYDVVNVTSMASGTFTINNPTGTPNPWQLLEFYLKSTTTNSLSWGNGYVAGQNALYTAIAAANKLHYICFVYDPTRAAWYQRTRGYEA